MDPIIIGFIYKFPEQSPWIILLGMILTGFNLPISEDLLIVLSAVWAGTFVPHKAVHLWLAILFGAYLADWVAYWTGRLLGAKLFSLPFFCDIISPKRLEKIHKFYEKYGLLSFVIGRFIPFGVRNCLFISAGMGKMTFKKFLLIDGIACLISTSIGFSVVYYLDRRFHLGTHLQVLLDYLARYDKLLIIVVVSCIVLVGGSVWLRHRLKKKTESNQESIPVEVETVSTDESNT